MSVDSFLTKIWKFQIGDLFSAPFLMIAQLLYVSRRRRKIEKGLCIESMDIVSRQFQTILKFVCSCKNKNCVWELWETHPPEALLLAPLGLSNVFLHLALSVGSQYHSLQYFMQTSNDVRRRIGRKLAYECKLPLFLNPSPEIGITIFHVVLSSVKTVVLIRLYCW